MTIQMKAVEKYFPDKFFSEFLNCHCAARRHLRNAKGAFSWFRLE